jgi:hypothetical protein
MAVYLDITCGLVALVLQDRLDNMGAATSLNRGATHGGKAARPPAEPRRGKPHRIGQRPVARRTEGFHPGPKATSAMAHVMARRNWPGTTGL